MTAAPLQLDFRRTAPSAWRWLGWALLLAAVAAVLALAEHHAAVERDHAAVQARHQSLSQALRAAEPRRSGAVPDAQMLADMRRANLIIDQLTIPWEPLFSAVEAADGRGLGLLSMAPTARDRTLRLSGEARNLSELLAYVERVADQPPLNGVHLLGHNNVQRDGANVVAFTMAATWAAPP
jgi:hypothetical protein